MVSIGELRADEVLDALELAADARVSAGEPASWVRELDDPAHVLLGARDEDGALVGVATGVVHGDIGDVLVVAVHADHRRRGVGAALTAALAGELEDRGAARVLLEVRPSNAAARTLYERQGFVQVDVRRGYYRDGADALVLAREHG